MSNKHKRLMGFAMFTSPFLFSLSLLIWQDYQSGTLWINLNLLANGLGWVILASLPYIGGILLVAYMALGYSMWKGNFDKEENGK